MRLRWLAVTAAGGAGAAVWGAAKGRRALLGTLGVEAALVGAACAAGMRRFTAPRVWPRDGSGLAYHVQARELFGLGAGHLGPGRRLVDGLPLVDYGPPGEQVNPAYAAWWALAHLTRFEDTGCATDRLTALTAVERLLALAHQRRGRLVWTYDFDAPVFGRVLRAGWISAMSQGLAISALVRAYRAAGGTRYLDAARMAAVPFAHPLAHDGVRTALNGHTYYEEYPGASSLVLDGSIFGLLGLYDLWVETHDEQVRCLFDEGAAGMAANLDVWDFLGLWSWYGAGGYLSPPLYHELNTTLLDVLGRLSGREELCEMAERWARVRGSRLRRAGAYAAYTATLYRAGLRGRLATLPLPGARSEVTGPACAE